MNRATKLTQKEWADNAKNFSKGEKKLRNNKLQNFLQLKEASQKRGAVVRREKGGKVKETREERLKRLYPERYKKYMAKKKQSGRSSAAKTKQTLNVISKRKGTPTEAAALKIGQKATNAAIKAGKSKVEAKKIGKKAAMNQMDSDRGKTNIAALWLAASFIPAAGVGVRAVQGARAAAQGIKTVQQVTGVVKKAGEASRGASSAATKLKGKLNQTAGYLKQSKKKQEALKKAREAAKKAKDKKEALEAAKQAKIKAQAKLKAMNVAGLKGLSTADRIKLGVTAAMVTAMIASKTAKKKPEKTVKNQSLSVNRRVVAAPPPKFKKKINQNLKKQERKDFYKAAATTDAKLADTRNGRNIPKVSRNISNVRKINNKPKKVVKDRSQKNGEERNWRKVPSSWPDKIPSWHTPGKDPYAEYDYLKVGGSIKDSMKKRTPKGRKRPSLRGWGAAQRGF